MTGGSNRHAESAGVDRKLKEGPDGTAVVLHVFQKKSKKGIATPKPDMDLIKDRLKAAAARTKEIENE